MEGGRSAVEFRLLGPVEALDGAVPLQLGGPRQRALLALLLLEPGQPVSSDRLAEELWQGEPPPRAEATLRSYASRLRRVLGQETLVARRGGYAALVAREDVDARRFERLLDEGRAALARGAAGLASERLEAALALWRGPALADVAHGGALAREARRLDELRLACHEERIEAELALGRHSALVPELRALVEAEPLRERLHRQLALALYRSGRQAEALAAYHDARRLLDDELGLEPGAELRELERAILRQEVAAVAPPETRHNLPAPTTSFVGRERELADLERLLREHRLVTLTGLGGTGKTRLALETAHRQADAWADGVWLVDLTALADAALVPAAVAEVLAVTAEGDEDRLLEALVAHARRRELLLVLDNCEHVAGASAELVEALLGGCPNVRVLATSRVPLSVYGERDYALDPLAVPGEGAADGELAELPSVRLFLERAVAVRRDVAADGAGLAAVATICRELDGLPLAIELAAARARALPPAAIAERLDDRFRFLRAWQRVADPRHRTLQTTMDWSYDLLATPERDLLDRLAVFAGGASLDAVAAVCFAGDEEHAVDTLERLVEASLVRAEPGATPRYRLLETVRQYAATKLADRPDTEEVRRRHAEHFLAVAEGANLSVESIGRGLQRPEIVVREQHNLRAALDWASVADVELALRLALALENFWVIHATVEGARRYEELLPRAQGLDPILRARATRDCAACNDVLHRLATAKRRYEESRGLFLAAGDELGVAHLDFRLGVVASLEGDQALSRRLWEQSLETFRQAGDVVGELQALGNLAALYHLAGERERARPMAERSIEMARELGWRWWEARAHASRAELAVGDGDPQTAEQEARLFLEHSWHTGNRQETLLALALLARAAVLRGEEERALALWASVEAVEDGPSRFGQFDRDEYAAAMPDGPRPAPLPLAEAVSLALAT